MTSPASQQGAPGRPGADEDTSAYRYGRFFRALGKAAAVVVVLLAAYVAWALITGRTSSDLIPLLDLFAISAVNGFQGIGNLLSTYRLTETRLHQERPLRSGREIPLGEIRRVFIGGTNAQIYASSEWGPDLRLPRRLEDGDELIEKLVGRLPPGVRVQHPSGELAGRLSGRA